VEDKIRGAYSLYGIGENTHKSLSGNTMARNNLKDLGVDGRI
jgi:hypothetical protein